jgi:hypothetical protein
VITIRRRLDQGLPQRNGIDVDQPGRTLANRDTLRITSTEASYK